MDAQRFLAEFGHIANGSDGISGLRELVLQLAILGRLVAQDESDTPVDETLAEVAVERAAYELEFGLRTTRHHPPIRTQPFAIPTHWKWVRLEQLTLYVQRGKGPKYAEGGAVSVVSQKCVQWSGFDMTLARRIDDDSIAAYGKERFLRDGDLLWNSTGTGTAGRVAVVQAVPHGQAVADSHVTVVRLASSLPRYVWCVIASPWIQARIHPAHPESLVSGTTQQVELATSTARALVIPCPPIEEQIRIVLKVEELMGLCDQLEQQQHERRKIQNTLRKSTLHTLASAQSPHELNTSWERLQANFGHLFSEVGDVTDLRWLIMDLAFVGRLSSAQAGDEDVGHLLKRTRDAKALRLATGEMRRKASAATDVVQLDLDLPEHWSKAALGELFQFIDYRGRTPTKTSSGVVLVTAKNVRPGRLKQEPIEYISEKSYAEWMTRGFPEVGDILFTTEAPLGNVALIETPPSFALAQRVIDLQPFADLNTRCAMYFMMSPAFQTALGRNSSGMTAKGIKAAKLKQLELPVPPVSEQVRIVIAVDRLMQICDELERHLCDAQSTASRLAIASVSALTGISVERHEDTSVKAPETELVALLRLATPPDVKAQAPLATMLARHEGEMAARDLWQRFGGEIDAFYAQLKAEVAHGWIAEPEPALVREKTTAHAARA
jgi:type I restriction enzyme S subunit